MLGFLLRVSIASMSFTGVALVSLFEVVSWTPISVLSVSHAPVGGSQMEGISGLSQPILGGALLVLSFVFAKWIVVLIRFLHAAYSACLLVEARVSGMAGMKLRPNAKISSCSPVNGRLVWLITLWSANRWLSELMLLSTCDL